MTQEELEVYKASVTLYSAQLKASMSSEEKVLLRFQCCDEAKQIMEHVKDMDIHTRLEDGRSTTVSNNSLKSDAIETFIICVKKHNGNLRKVSEELGFHYKTARNWSAKYIDPSYIHSIRQRQSEQTYD